EDLLLHSCAKYGYQPLCFDAEELGQRKGGDGLHDDGTYDTGEEHFEQLHVLVRNHLIDKIFAGPGKNEPGETTNGNENETDQEKPSPRPDERPEDFGHGNTRFLLLHTFV